MLITASSLKGYAIEATDGHVGTVADLLFDDKTWQLRWLVMATGGWLNGRQILIHPSALKTPDRTGRAFVVNQTRAQIEASPEIAEHAPVSMQMETQLYGYYGWSDAYYPNAMAESPILPRPPAGAQPLTPQAAAAPDRHLRSLAEVSRYAIAALDGNVGHFETFLVDSDSWAIAYLVVDTAEWWMGNHVLIAPVSVTNIDWRDREIAVNLTGYKIKGSPAWDKAGVLDRAREQVLRLYYGWGTLGEGHVPPLPTPAPTPAPAAAKAPAPAPHA